jgi:predicted nucleic acid-binding protein
MSVVVSDTSPLHYLILCSAESILPRMFLKVVIPPTVFAELTHANAPAAVKEWAGHLPVWVSVQAPAKLDPTILVDQGELEAICLAREIGAAAILMDDLKGRNAALRCGLRVTGTIGILEAAATHGWLDLADAIEKLRKSGARLDGRLVAAVLERERERRKH